jgi:hypothetical protein
MNAIESGLPQSTVSVDFEQLQAALTASLGRNPVHDEQHRSCTSQDVARQVWNKLERMAATQRRRSRQRLLARAKWTLVGWTACFFVGGVYAGLTTDDWLLLTVGLSMVSSGTIMWSVVQVFDYGTR